MLSTFHTETHPHRFQCIVHLSINHLHTKWCLLMLRCCFECVCWIFSLAILLFGAPSKMSKHVKKNVKYMYIHSVHCKYIMWSILRVMAAWQRYFNSEMLLRSPKKNHIHMYTMQSHKSVDIAQIFKQMYNIHYQMVTYGAFNHRNEHSHASMNFWTFLFASVHFTNIYKLWAWS